MRNTIEKGSRGQGVERTSLESSNPEIYENYWHTGDEYKFAE
jgi:hypothetical protein